MKNPGMSRDVGEGERERKRKGGGECGGGGVEKCGAQRSVCGVVSLDGGVSDYRMRGGSRVGRREPRGSREGQQVGSGRRVAGPLT